MHIIAKLPAEMIYLSRVTALAGDITAAYELVAAAAVIHAIFCTYPAHA